MKQIQEIFAFIRKTSRSLEIISHYWGLVSSDLHDVWEIQKEEQPDEMGETN